MTLSPGARLGPYEILAPLGAGGMGEVYRARDTKLDRDVALKVLPSQLSANAEAVSRFEREAKAVAALSHPNILSIHDFGRHEGIDYAVTELLDGETLRQKLGGSPLPSRKAIDYALQIAHGLAAAHDKGVVHRDLKPDNLFVTKDGRVKILDFGLAKLTAAEGSAPLTQSPTLEQGTVPGTVMGTMGYMSPEQVRGTAADARSDIFAFGAILYEMIAGVRAFKGDTAADTMSAILKEDPPEIAVTGRGVPPGLERILRHCLEKSPAERFQSARDIAFALEALSGTSSTGSQSAAAAGAPQKSMRAPAIAVTLVAACLALAFTAGLWLGHGRADRSVTFRRMNFRVEMIFRAAFAPDGQTVVYSGALLGNVPEIFTISRDYPDPRPLGLAGTHLLGISSKGELALLVNSRFIAHQLFTGTLARMPMGGGAPREILENVRDAAWTPDGSDLAIIRSVEGRDRLELPAGKVLAESPGYFSDLRVSPDGKRIAYFEHPIKWDDRGSVAVVDLEGKKTILSEGWSGEEGLAWSPDGGEIFFSAEAGYTSFYVYAVTLSGRKRVALASAGGQQIHDISRDGRWLVTREDGRRDLYALPPGATAERALSWLDLSEAIDISPDGRTLLFTEESEMMGPNYSVCIRKTDGSPPVRLGEGFAGALSPDGKWALSVVPTSPDQLVLYPTGPGDLRRLERGPITNYVTARWFPDGKKVLVCGSGPSSPSRCYAQEVDGGLPRAVTPEGTTDGFVSPDGKQAVVSQGSGRFLLCPLDGGEPRPLPFLDPTDAVSRWAADGRSLIVYGFRQVPNPIERVDLQTGQRERIRKLAPADMAGVLHIQPVTVTSDLSAYAYSIWRERSSLYLVEGAR